MIASLPMYLRPETIPAHEALWALTRDRLRDDGIDAPDALSHDLDPWDGWTSPALLLGQTCSLPFRARLAAVLDIVGAPDFDLPGTRAGHYYSVIVARAVEADRPVRDLLANGRFVRNDPLSQSGWAAPQALAAAYGIALSPIGNSGSHQASATAVAAGEADVAALDAVTWRLLKAHEPAAEKLAPVFRTPDTPGLPFVTARGGPVIALRAALNAAVSALPAADREILGLRCVCDIPRDSYLSLPLPS